MIRDKEIWHITWAYVISDLDDEEMLEHFSKKNCKKKKKKKKNKNKIEKEKKKKKKKKNQNKFKVEKVIKRKGDKLYLTWKGYHNSFNSWVDKKNYIV